MIPQKYHLMMLLTLFANNLSASYIKDFTIEINSKSSYISIPIYC